MNAFARVAAVYDIHGNLPALESVLEEIAREGVDLVVVGGDVLPGPMPRETLQLLQELGGRAQFLYGNGEVAVLEALAGSEPAAVPQQYRPAIRWTAEQLDQATEQWLRQWPKTLRLRIAGLGDVLLCHATPRSENDCFTRLTAEAPLLPIFESLNVDCVVCGHTHMQFDRTVGDIRVLNAGSVGMPFGQPGADWLLLGSGVQFRHTSYDVEEAARRVAATSYPDARNLAEQYILHPPAAEKMLDLFTRAGLQ